MIKKDILSLGLDELQAEIVTIQEQKFRAKQIYEWLHRKRVTSFTEMSNLSAQLISKLDENFYINSLKIKKKLVSGVDNTVKYLYELADGEKVESVMMEYNHGNSLCISTQVGCKMKCSFCASTIAGFVRDLTPAEMLLQIYETERDSGKKIDSIVLMGIGEPLDNFENVIKFFKLVSDNDGNNMSLRHISVSTCGLVDRINELADMKLGVTLSVSLHAPTNEKRDQIMPINKRYRVEELIAACKNYFEQTGRRISFEFALISGVNDDARTADELIRLLKPLNPCHVNLIPVNEVRETGYKKSSFVKGFQERLKKGGINATIRRTLGSDINAACGQLRRDNM